MIEHAIPGYNYYAFANMIQSDEPFARKAQAAVVTGASSFAHLAIFTRSGLQHQNHMIKTLRYSSGKTHGWGAIRFMVTNPVSRAGLVGVGAVAAGAGISYAIAGEKGVDDYNEFISEPKHYGFRTAWAIARLIEHYS